ncbi:hypothetical protein WICPIJ_003673 [Wickerhamomyces pijperi]|uniref:Oxo-4-hydroxy-4-carboxy-5-ureidoimidazoline decarboxylase domain-containing protein n=1 Tax=Wickerhamomyces pijperi TaxID=599730 RepID=A0A9P8TNG4_WICPI|nr:hypothetical protein WICPIJ_003673 [Wickerhamomyces pijperi]
MSYKLPSISTLTTLPTEEQTTVLNHLFEPHSSIHKYLQPLLLTSNTYESYPDFINSCRSRFLLLKPSSDLTKDIISSHPRLGLPKDTVQISSHSLAEQANLQSGTTESDTLEFIKLNSAYESRYPGLRFVLFVNGRGKDEIKLLFKQRIQRNDYDMEVNEALNAMCDIALDRVKKLQAETKL